MRLASADSIARKLNELQLFSGPGVLAVLNWRELDGDLALVSSVQGELEARGEAPTRLLPASPPDC